MRAVVTLLIVLTAQVLIGQEAAPQSAAEWFQRGVTLHEKANYPAALEAFTKARELGYAQRGPLNLRIARAQARSGQHEAALSTLRLMVDNGYPRPDALNAENDFIPVRSDARWAGIIEAAQANQRRCANGAEFRQFDFWLGEWDVEIGGQRSARSSIQLILADCTVFENFWTLDGSYAGKSFSVWDRQQSRWEQRYVDTTGASRDWFGRLDEGRMLFYLRPDANGGSAVQRMTYTKESPDRVRQTIELSTDGEKTWSVVFDGLYVRRQ